MMKLKEIKAVIRKDANGTGVLNDGNGHFCAQGGLALAAGISEEDLTSSGINLNYEEINIVSDKFNIPNDVLEHVFKVNDHFAHVRTRRKALIEYFERCDAGEKQENVLNNIVNRHRGEYSYLSGLYSGPYIPLRRSSCTSCWI